MKRPVFSSLHPDKVTYNIFQVDGQPISLKIFKFCNLEAHCKWSLTVRDLEVPDIKQLKHTLKWTIYTRKSQRSS